MGDITKWVRYFIHLHKLNYTDLRIKKSISMDFIDSTIYIFLFLELQKIYINMYIN